jgi:hypothetical protein
VAGAAKAAVDTASAIAAAKRAYAGMTELLEPGWLWLLPKAPPG